MRATLILPGDVCLKSVRSGKGEEWLISAYRNSNTNVP
jgi:hypothetical protein